MTSLLTSVEQVQKQRIDGRRAPRAEAPKPTLYLGIGLTGRVEQRS